MRILFAGANDWANIAHEAARSINVVAPHTARVWVQNKHPYGYLEGDLHPEEAWRDRQDLLILVNSGDGDYVSMDRIVGQLGLTPDAFVALHVGSAYRHDPTKYEEEDAARGALLRVVGCSLLRFALGGPLEPITIPFYPAHGRAMAHPADRSDELLVSHSPSTRLTKGTRTILAACENVDVIEAVSHRACLERRSKSNVFVCQMCPRIGGIGVSAIEALAQGCVVLADIRHVRPEVFARLVPPPIIHVESEENLRVELERLADADVRRDLQALSRKWSLDNTAAQPVGRYWLAQITKRLDAL